MNKKIVTCKSGAIGIRQKLQTIYDDYQDFLIFNKMYFMHERLGFNSPLDLWNANPTVEGSCDPTDFRIVEPEIK